MKTINGSGRTYDFIKRDHLVVIRCLFLVITMFLASCEPPAPLNKFTAKFVSLDRKIVYRLEEIDRFSLNADHLPVKALRYSALTNQLLGISEGSTRIVGYDLSSKELVLETNIQLPNFTPIDFDKEGKLLLGAIAYEAENFSGIGIWNVVNGELVECVTYPCDKKSIGGYPGVVLDPDAKYTVTFDDSSFGITDILDSGIGASASYVNNPDADYWGSIGKIAVDTNNDRLAIIFQEGKLWLDEVNPQNKIAIGPLRLYIPIANGKQNDLQTIYAAKFNATGELLAVVRGDRLLIYRVGKYGGRLVSQFSLGQEEPRILNFNPTSELLFVVGEDTIKIMDLKAQKELVELPADGVTAITISDDNRLLICGDEEGTVHIWAALKQ